MKTSLAVMGVFFAILVRLSRWLSILQQKEYRFDRLFLFIKSGEGVVEFLRIFPKKNDFSRNGFKRPRATARMISTTLLLILAIFAIVGFACLYVFSLGFTPLVLIFILLLLWFLLLLCIPVLVFLTVFPTAIIAWLVTEYWLFRCRSNIRLTKPVIIGVTGSYGKTTVKLLLAWVLSSHYSTYVTKRSFNTTFSIARSIAKEYSGQEVMVVEYGAYKRGEIARIAKSVKPVFAVLSGFASQHLGLFGSTDAIIKAKSELVAALPEDAVVVCNAYNPETKKILLEGKKGKSIKERYITQETLSEMGIKNARLNSELKLCFSCLGKDIETQLVGMHYMQTVALVIATAKELTLSSSEIQSTLSSFSPSEMYIQIGKYTVNGALVINDGRTANEAGFIAMLALVAEKASKSHPSQKRVLLFSGIVDLGDQSSRIHREIALLAKELFTTVLYSGKTGFSEFSEVFKSKCIYAEDNSKILEHLNDLSKNDLIVLEGKTPHYAAHLF